jgi:uncharacterized phage-like protein YoqJ
MIISFTGHRNDKLGGWILPNPTYINVCKQTAKILRELNPDKCISGMALGYDQWGANICIKLGIPFIAAVPFEEQDKIWPEKSKRIYNTILEKAESIIIISEGGYHPSKMQIRNEWLVDQCDKLLACFDGSPGGTANCVKYAKLVKKSEDIIFINPSLTS